MKTLLKKEIRLLLPAWITAMVLAIVPRFSIIMLSRANHPHYSPFLEDSFFTNLIFAAGALFLGVNSFGEELGYNTFSGLLTQPMRRPRIWVVKIATLATAFILVWFTAVLFTSWQIGILNHRHPGLQIPDFGETVEFLSLSTLVAFSGGLWTTLLLRQVTGAFWFTLLTPLAIILGISTVFQDWIGWSKGINTLIVAAMVLYSVAGFFLARRLFLRAQDIQSAGGEISFPRREHISDTGARRFSLRPRHWLSAMGWKELQLHQGTLFISAIILVLHLTAYFIRKIHPFLQNSNLEFILETIWLLWLLMPLLIGASAIAEERRLGTLAPQLCLPIARGTQLIVKFCIALVLSLVLGVLTPVLIEGTKTLDRWDMLLAIAAGVFFTGFYASSLGRTALQSIGWAILVGLVIYTEVLVPALRRPQGYFDPQLEIKLLRQYLNGAILLIVLGWLTFSNFKHEHQNWKFWTGNITAIIAVFICGPLLFNICLWVLSVRTTPY